MSRRVNQAALVACLAFAFYSILVTVGWAQRMVPCSPRDKVIEGLREGFGEEVVARGLLENGNMYEVYAKRTEEQTFTIIITTPSGLSCQDTAGTYWEDVEPAAPKGQGL